eukprot:435665-Pleurochrysis_carterae.AAC.1
MKSTVGVQMTSDAHQRHPLVAVHSLDRAAICLGDARARVDAREAELPLAQRRVFGEVRVHGRQRLGRVLHEGHAPEQAHALAELRTLSVHSTERVREQRGEETVANAKDWSANWHRPERSRCGVGTKA